MVFGAAFALGIVLAFLCAVRYFVAAAIVASLVLAAVVGGGAVHMLLTALGAFVLCQVGYGLGLGLRALLRPSPKPAPEPEATKELPNSIGGQRQR